MDRIAIIGCGGSGKSHLARELGASLGLTPGSPRRRVLRQGLEAAGPRTSSPALQRDLVSAPRWIIDGNYASTLPIRLAAADTVIFLDLPAWACLWGIAQRRLRHGGGQHQAIGVYDRITWNFVRYILGYRRSMAPRVRALIAGHAADAAGDRAAQPPRRPPLPRRSVAASRRCPAAPEQAAVPSREEPAPPRPLHRPRPGARAAVRLGGPDWPGAPAPCTEPG